MTLEQEAEVQRLIKDIDVTELMDMLKKHGNRYSRGCNLNCVKACS